MYKFDFRDILEFEEYNTDELKELVSLMDNKSIPYIFFKDDLIENVIRVKDFTDTFKFEECELEKHTQFIREIKNQIFK